MPPEKFDTTFAIKAICLSDKLNGTDKRVAVTIIDHHNRKTGRCDPSRKTIAELLGIDPRTVSRSIKKVVKHGFLDKVRHGGNNHCNSYQPRWKFYRWLEENWKQRRRHHANRFVRQRMSSSEGQGCQFSGGKSASQTCSTKPVPSTNKPVPSQSAEDAGQSGLGNGMVGSANTHNNSPRSIILGSTPSAEAARDSAERRWNIGLLNLFGQDPVLYGAVVDAIDSSLKSMATDTEMKRPGAGLECLLRELSKRGILSSRA
jgi:DNA-binding transcriptional regulator YhcF (GntR family)